jgi:tetratricopeptide (TPR) repeat protein
MKKILILVLIAFLAACSTTGGPEKTKMAEGYYMRGLSHMKEKNYELAAVEFNRSVQTDSNYKESYYMLGIISDDRGQYDSAATYYKEAIERDSGYSEAYNALGVVYSKQQKWIPALKAFKKALENKLYTTPHVPTLNIGRLYMAQKEYDKAIESYRDAKRLAKMDFIVYELGSALLEAGKVKESIAEFREGTGISPLNADFRYSLGQALLKDGNKKAAVAEFKKAAELAPGSDIARQAKDYMKTLR